MTYTAEREALQLLHRLGRRQAFRAVFAEVVRKSRETSGFEATAWRDLEELLAIDMDARRTA
jgi:hypothetical protein